MRQNYIKRYLTREAVTCTDHFATDVLLQFSDSVLLSTHCFPHRRKRNICLWWPGNCGLWPWHTNVSQSMSRWTAMPKISRPGIGGGPRLVHFLVPVGRLYLWRAHFWAQLNIIYYTIAVFCSHSDVLTSTGNGNGKSALWFGRGLPTTTRVQWLVPDVSLNQLFIWPAHFSEAFAAYGVGVLSFESYRTNTDTHPADQLLYSDHKVVGIKQWMSDCPCKNCKL